MKYFIRFILCITTFFIAVNITWGVYLFENQMYFDDINEITCERFCFVPMIKNFVKANPQGTIEVKFLRIKEVDEKFIVEFEVINNSPSALYYSAYGSGEDAPSIIKVDEVLQPSPGCRTGLLTFHLHSGESLKMNMSEFDFYPDIDENSNLEIGYFFRLEHEKEGKIYWSQNFQMPKDFEKH